MRNRPLCIRAVLFDFDGTLTRPGALDFSVIKQALGCPSGTPVLEFIEDLPKSRRRKAMSELELFEVDAAARSESNEGAEGLIHYLRAKGVLVGIISRNCLQSIERALDNFDTINRFDFEVIISREEPVRPKPSADGIFLAAKKINIDVQEILVVGDYVFDIQAGQRAGALTAFLNNRTLSMPLGMASDFTIDHLEEVKKIVGLRLSVSAGKLPNDLLEGVP